MGRAAAIEAAPNDGCASALRPCAANAFRRARATHAASFRELSTRARSIAMTDVRFGEGRRSDAMKALPVERLAARKR
jgi:hypothetical protein